MTLADVRAAALDRALVDDDPTAALALAGVVDAADADGAVDDPLAAAMLAVRCVGRSAVDSPRSFVQSRHGTADGSLEDGAWRPGDPTDDAVLAGAAVAVRRRNVPLGRAATLADCSPATLEAVVERQRRRKERE